MIQYINPSTNELLIEAYNGLLNMDQRIIFPLLNGVYIIDGTDNYAANFGFEWQLFSRTQLDKHIGLNVSKHRFFLETRWQNISPDENMLEVGCGAGRFSQIVLQHTQANLYTVDLSDAVQVNFQNNGPHNRLKLFRASVYALPFKNETFDKVFCFGVLQHTIDVKKSVQCLVDMVKPGGEIVLDFYPLMGWYSKINAKYLLRPFFKKMNHEKLLKLIRKNIDWMIKLHQFNNKIGLGVLNRFIPVCDITNTVPSDLNKRDFREWVVLDTFDMFSPAYDQPQRLKTVAQWLTEFGMTDVDAQMITYYKKNTAATVKAKKPLSKSIS